MSFKVLLISAIPARRKIIKLLNELNEVDLKSIDQNEVEQEMQEVDEQRKR